MRNASKSRYQYDHKFMEEAFLKGLKHVLLKKFFYIIVADQGFGNDRFMKLCEDCGFDYMMRTTPNMMVINIRSERVLMDICQTDGAYISDVVT